MIFSTVTKENWYRLEVPSKWASLNPDASYLCFYRTKYIKFLGIRIPIKHREVLVKEDNDWLTNAILPDPMNPTKNRDLVKSLFRKIWPLKRGDTVAIRVLSTGEIFEATVIGFDTNCVKTKRTIGGIKHKQRIALECILDPEDYALSLLTL